ncbi:MAG: Maf family protein [Candidatus Sericytochromatia bacterium]
MKLVLASASPRRKELLELVGATFDIIAGNIEEIIDESLPLTQKIEKLALQKAEAVAKYLSGDFIVIGADTIVELDGEILGKPQNIDDAKRMIRNLSGKSHNVITAIALIPTNNKYKPITTHQVTPVKFKELSEKEIENYVNYGESMDKAGAYAVQGFGVLIIEGVYGCYTNVVGLPIPLLNKTLKEHFNLSFL